MAVAARSSTARAGAWPTTLASAGHLERGGVLQKRRRIGGCTLPSLANSLATAAAVKTTTRKGKRLTQAASEDVRGCTSRMHLCFTCFTYCIKSIGGQFYNVSSLSCVANLVIAAGERKHWKCNSPCLTSANWRVVRVWSLYCCSTSLKL